MEEESSSMWKIFILSHLFYTLSISFPSSLSSSSSCCLPLCGSISISLLPLFLMCVHVCMNGRRKFFHHGRFFFSVILLSISFLSSFSALLSCTSVSLYLFWHRPTPYASISTIASLFHRAFFCAAREFSLFLFPFNLFYPSHYPNHRTANSSPLSSLLSCIHAKTSCATFLHPHISLFGLLLRRHLTPFLIFFCHIFFSLFSLVPFSLSLFLFRLMRHQKRREERTKRRKYNVFKKTRVWLGRGFIGVKMEVNDEEREKKSMV